MHINIKEITQGIKEVPAFQLVFIRDRNILTAGDKKRCIYAPNEAMKKIHRDFINYLRKLDVDFEYAIGGRPGNSPRSNVCYHRKNRFFYLLDFRNAYGSVDLEKTVLMFTQLDFGIEGDEDNKILFEFLRKYFFIPEGGLLTGGPASPDIFNLYTDFYVDRELGKWCKGNKITYTRYIDDLTFSSPKPITTRKRKEIRRIIHKAGFIVNHKKSRVYDIRKGPVFINGIGLEQGGRIFVPRSFLSKFRGALHRSLTKNDIDPNQIYGMAGVIFSVLGKNPQNLTRAEEKALELYYKFLQRQKELQKTLSE